MVQVTFLLEPIPIQKVPLCDYPSRLQRWSYRREFLFLPPYTLCVVYNVRIILSHMRYEMVQSQFEVRRAFLFLLVSSGLSRERLPYYLRGSCIRLPACPSQSYVISIEQSP